MDDSVESGIDTEQRGADSPTTAHLLADDDSSSLIDSSELDRWQAAKYVAPFLFIGLADVVLLLGWGLDPLWGFMILPPILFVSVLAWIAFRTGFVSERTDEA